MQVLGFVAFSSLCLTTGAFAPGSSVRGQTKPLFSTSTKETEQAPITTDWVAEAFETLTPSDVFDDPSVLQQHSPSTSYLDSMPSIIHHPVQGHNHMPNMMYTMPADMIDTTEDPLPLFHGKNQALAELENQFDLLNHAEIQMDVDSTPQHFLEPMQGHYHMPNMMYTMPASPNSVTAEPLPLFHGKNKDLGELENQFAAIEHEEIQMEVDSTPQHFLEPVQGHYHKPNAMYTMPASPDSVTEESLPIFHGKNEDLGELENQFATLEHTEIQTEVDQTPHLFLEPMQGHFHKANMMYTMPASPDSVTEEPLPIFHGKNQDLGELENQFATLKHTEIQMEVDSAPQHFLEPMQGHYHKANMMGNMPASPKTDTETKDPLPPFQGKNEDLGELQNQFDMLEHTEIQMHF